MFKQPNPFIAGLPIVDEFTLYEMAQLKYLERYGHIHTRAYKIRHLYRESITEEEIVALEIICKRLISGGDHVLTLFLGWGWRCLAESSDDGTASEIRARQPAYKKALYWYTEAMIYERFQETARGKITRITQELSTLSQ